MIFWNSDKDRKVAFSELATPLSGLVGIVGIFFFLVASILLHRLAPEISIITDYISDYANTPYSGLFQASLAFHGFGNLTIAVGLLFSIRASRTGRAGAAFFAAASIGAIIAAVFPIDSPGTLKTAVGSVHAVAAAVSFVLEAVAFLFLARAFRTMHMWQNLATPVLLVAITGTAGVVWFFAARQSALAGLAEHAVFFLFLLLEITVGLRLVILRPSRIFRQVRQFI